MTLCASLLHALVTVGLGRAAGAPAPPTCAEWAATSNSVAVHFEAHPGADLYEAQLWPWPLSARADLATGHPVLAVTAAAAPIAVADLDPDTPYWLTLRVHRAGDGPRPPAAVEWR
jgi:hypothetical protein